MITDEQLNKIAIGFGLLTFSLIVVYHTITSTTKNMKAD
jgi:hypothetical protein